MSRMSLPEILAILIQNNALIVHCAGMAKGVGDATTASLGYLERLEHASRNKFELSCSTIVPGDVCSFERMNYTGKVGLVLRPNTVVSITFTSPNDAGSQIDPTRPGRRTHNCGPVSLQSIEAAISGRALDRYNEFGLHQFSVVGVFVDPPIQYSTDIGFNDVSVDEVAQQFPDLALYCLRGGLLHTLCKERDRWNVGQQVSAVDVYSGIACQ